MPLTTKDIVLGELLSNLRSLVRGVVWSEQQPLVTEYILKMSESHRTYHTWKHLEFMFVLLKTLPPSVIQNPLRLKAAILFHDSVYDVGAKDNEEKSAQFASKFYQGTNLAKIIELIEATSHVVPFQKYGDDRDVLCDLDLSILGAPLEEFKAYRIAIACEFEGRCTAKEFNNGTRAFCHKMLTQSRDGGIFRTESFKHLEQQAFENLSWLFGKLSAT